MISKTIVFPNAFAEVDMDIFQKLGLSNSFKGCGNAFEFYGHGKNLTTINPASGQILAEIQTGTQSDMESVILKAKLAFELWKNEPASKRGEIIRQIGHELRRYKDELGTLISLEMGKTKQEGDGEVQEMIDMADFSVGQSRMLYGKTMHSERPKHRLYEQWHPLGIVGIITAFNFPMAVWAWNAFLAIVCGNSVIWKPSSKTPLCAIAVHKICQEVMRINQTPDIFSLVIPESRQIAASLVQDKRIALVSFTGSTKAGREVALKVAQRFGKSLLELGGNNAVIVDETAELKSAATAITFAAVGTSGQRCTSTRRVFIERTIYEKLKLQLKHLYQQIKIGSPLDKKNHMGPLIDDDALQLYARIIEQIKQDNGIILFGGQIIEGPGYYVEPTIVEGLDPKHPLLQQENFIPVVYLVPYEKFNQAIEWQNEVSQGLSSALFTQNLQHAEWFLSSRGSDCGIANINIGTSGAEITGAFGGEKETGGGREAGSDAWQAYMRRQTNTINWGEAITLAQGIKFSLG
jgi:aldehyde dehydrogenase (NAD+)